LREVLKDLSEKLDVRQLLNESSVGLKTNIMPRCGFGVLMKSATQADPNNHV
jgi:hypothetical protein